nr:MAG TPA: hypothetical protein [Caudoviricetes sp.]
MVYVFVTNSLLNSMFNNIYKSRTFLKYKCYLSTII